MGADGPLRHHWVEVQELTWPLLQEGASRPLGVGGSLPSTGDGEDPDCSPGLPRNQLFGEGESFSYFIKVGSVVKIPSSYVEETKGCKKQ